MNTRGAALVSRSLVAWSVSRDLDVSLVVPNLNECQHDGGRPSTHCEACGFALCTHATGSSAPQLGWPLTGEGTVGLFATTGAVLVASADVVLSGDVTVVVVSDERLTAKTIAAAPLIATNAAATAM